MRFAQKRKNILKISAEIKTLESKMKKLIEDLQNECSHPAVIEAERFWLYDSEAAIPSIRKCCVCGLVETNNSFGYDKLKNRKVIKSLPGKWGNEELYKCADIFYLDTTTGKILSKLIKKAKK